MHGQALEHASLMRAQEIVRLRVNDGLSWREIGERVGMTYSGARKLFLRHMDQLKAHTRQEFRVAQTMELMRLDALWKINFQKATDEAIDDDVQQRASIVCLRISERRAKILGIDAAERVELTGGEGGPITFDMSGYSDEALEKELGQFFKPEYMQGAADAYKVAEENAAVAALPPAETEDVQHDEAEDEEAARTQVTVMVQPDSQGQARV